MIRHLLAEGVATDDDVMTLDGELVWKDGAACADPEGDRPRMYFQRVPEPRAAKNRMHLDLRVAGPSGRRGRAAHRPRRPPHRRGPAGARTPGS